MPNGQHVAEQFQKDLQTSYNYQGLGNSINGSIKFVSLINDVSNYWKQQAAEPQVVLGSFVANDPSSVANDFAQDYLKATFRSKSVTLMAGAMAWGATGIVRL